MTGHALERMQRFGNARRQRRLSGMQPAARHVWPKRPDFFAGHCTAITSLNPNPARMIRQLHCLQSWIDYGLPVIVVNTAAELRQMYLPAGAEGFASDDLTIDYDRPTQRISALVAAGIETGKQFLLINSDIEISGHTCVLMQALNQPEKLTIGVRWNYDGVNEARAEEWGLDCFLMTPDLARSLPQLPFGIGKPMWDYWVPHHFRSRGVKFHWIQSPFFFHELHAIGWSNSEWMFGAKVLQAAYKLDLTKDSTAFRRSLNDSGATS